MKKFLFLLLSFFGVLGVSAQQTITISGETGTFYRGAGYETNGDELPTWTEGAATQYAHKWIYSGTNPSLTLTCQKNNIVIDSQLRIHTDSYILETNPGFKITGYSFSAYTAFIGSTITPDGQDAIDVSMDPENPTLIEVKDLNDETYPMFDVVTGNPWIVINSFTVTLEVDPEFDYAKYVVRNVGSGLYWGAGNDWGTQASLLPHPEYLKWVPQNDGTYFLESQVNNGGTSYYFEGTYMDNANPKPLTITKLENGNYSIASSDGANLYGYDGTSTVLGKNLTDVNDPNAQWTITALADMPNTLAAASVENPVDATFFIEDHDFGRNNRYVSKWTMVASNQNLSGGNNVNNCAESYHSVFTLSQNITGAPNGVYALTAQGFYRQDGSDNENLPVFYINDATGTFPLKTGAENSMSDASASFTNGLYTIEPIFVKVEDGNITLGAKLETNVNLWCIWDNFVLTYYGNVSIEEAQNAALIAQVKDLRAKAEALKNAENVSEAAIAAIDAALAATTDVDTSAEALNAAISALSAAIDKGDAAVAIAPKLLAADVLMASTNVYTADALAAYKDICDEVKAKYDNGTLTFAEANAFNNPYQVTAWRAGNSFDDLLLSAWTINDVQCQDFNTSLYINTWSVEGETDGSNFKVPFYEYWANDAQSLPAANLTANLTGIPEGEYDVTAWVRVRMKNGATAPATGITLKVNNGVAVDVAAGDRIGTSQFYLAKVKTSGQVLADGSLKINFNVAENNNISWLSFQNVNYTKVDVEALLAEVLAKADKLQAIIDAAGTYEDEYEAAKSANTMLQNIRKTTCKSRLDVENVDFRIDYTARLFFRSIKAKAAIDITDFCMKNASPVENLDGWSGTAINDNSDGVADYLNVAGASFSQRAYLPTGTMRITAEALTRTDMEAYLYVDDDSVAVATVGSDVVNTHAQAASWFDAGNGKNAIELTMDLSRKVKIVLKADEANGDHWLVWRNFKIELLPEPNSDVVGLQNIDAETAETALYDLSGRRITKAAKGLYIVNGKKVMIK